MFFRLFCLGFFVLPPSSVLFALSSDCFLLLSSADVAFLEEELTLQLVELPFLEPVEDFGLLRLDFVAVEIDFSRFLLCFVSLASF